MWLLLLPAPCPVCKILFDSSPYEKVSAPSSQHLHSHLDSFGHLSLIKWIKVITFWLQLYINQSNPTLEK